MNDGRIFNGKNILLVCAETQSWPMHYVAEILKKTAKSISAIYIQPGETYLGAQDYRKFKELNPDIKIYDLSDLVQEYLDGIKNITVNLDLELVRKFEEKYSKYSLLNEQFLAEMLLTPYYHDRNFYKFVPHENILYFAQLYYQRIEDILASNKFDVILDCDVDFFGRAVLLEVSKNLEIPYISVDHSRVDGYLLPTRSLCKEIHPKIKSFFSVKRLNSLLKSDPAINLFLQSIIDGMGEIPKVYKEDYKRFEFSLYRNIRGFIGYTYRFFRHPQLRLIYLTRVRGISSPLFGDPIGKLFFIWMYYIRRIYMRVHSPFDGVDIRDSKYIYVPLHVIPESSTTVLSPIYINEAFIIESLSKSVACDVKIVVKEHWSMLGYRPLSFYKKIKKIPNVILVDPELKRNPKYYIKNALLIATISGSSALEGAILGKNSLVFCDVLFNLLERVKKIHIDIELKDIIKKHQAFEDTGADLYAYIALILEFGAKVDLKKLYIAPGLGSEREKDSEAAALLQVFENGFIKLSTDQ